MPYSVDSLPLDIRIGILSQYLESIIPDIHNNDPLVFDLTRILNELKILENKNRLYLDK